MIHTFNHLIRKFLQIFFRDPSKPHRPRIALVYFQIAPKKFLPGSKEMFALLIEIAGAIAQVNEPNPIHTQP